MKSKPSADRPKGKVHRPTACRTSDLEFGFEAPVLPDHHGPGDSWRCEQLEEEHGLRLDVYRAVGLM